MWDVLSWSCPWYLKWLRFLCAFSVVAIFSVLQDICRGYIFSFCARICHIFPYTWSLHTYWKILHFARYSNAVHHNALIVEVLFPIEARNRWTIRKDKSIFFLANLNIPHTADWMPFGTTWCQLINQFVHWLHQGRPMDNSKNSEAYSFSISVAILIIRALPAVAILAQIAIAEYPKVKTLSFSCSQIPWHLKIPLPVMLHQTPVRYASIL